MRSALVTSREVFEICAVSALDPRSVRKAYATPDKIRPSTTDRLEQACRSLDIATPAQAALALSFLGQATA